MARPIKPGVDYFPLDVVLDTKFELMEAEFGLNGFAIVVKLYQKIYGEQGYYCEWTNEVALLFARKCGVGVNVVSEIVKSALKRGIFDKDKFEHYGILTSAGIQNRYLTAKKSNDTSKICREYLLLSAPKNRVNATKTGVLEEKTGVLEEKIPQSKIKESKVNKSIVYNTKSPKGQHTHIDIPFNLIQMFIRYSKSKPTSEDENKMTKWLKTFEPELICEAFKLAQGKEDFVEYATEQLRAWYKQGILNYIDYIFQDKGDDVNV